MEASDSKTRPEKLANKEPLPNFRSATAANCRQIGAFSPNLVTLQLRGQEIAPTCLTDDAAAL